MKKNLNYFIHKAYIYVYNHYKSKNTFYYFICNIKDKNDNNIVTKLEVCFERKGKQYNKNIYIIISKEMELNITNKYNTQYFTDTTFYAISPYNKGSKI